MASLATTSRPRSNSPPHKRIRLDEPSETPTSASSLAPPAAADTTQPIRQHKKGKKSKKPPPPEPCSPEDVNLRDIYSILGPDAISEAVKSSAEYAAPLALYTEVELTIKDVSSHGEST